MLVLSIASFSIQVDHRKTMLVAFRFLILLYLQHVDGIKEVAVKPMWISHVQGSSSTPTQGQLHSISNLLLSFCSTQKPSSIVAR